MNQTPEGGGNGSRASKKRCRPIGKYKAALSYSFKIKNALTLSAEKRTPSLPHEKTYVEIPIIEQLKQMGWAHNEIMLPTNW